MLRAVKFPTEHLEFDLAVLGDGAIGMATAIEYTRRNPDARVAVVAPAGRRDGASTAAGLMLNAFGELEPGQLEHPGGQARFALARRALRTWPTWLEELGELAGTTPPSIRQGTVILAPTGDVTIDVIAQALAQEHEPHIRISPADIPGYSPTPEHAAEMAIFLPREGAIPAAQVMALMDRAAANSSIARIEGRAQAIAHAPGRSTVELEDSRTLSARSILVAAGAWSSAIIDSIPELSARCPRVHFGTGRAYHVTHAADDPSPRPRTVLRLPNHPSGGSYHLVPFDDNSAYVGASNHVSATPEPDPLHAAFALEDVADHLRIELKNAQVRPVHGHRPISSDGMPLIGRTDLEGIFLATGTRRDGFTSAPVIARDLVCEMLLGKPMLDPVFKPDRSHTPDLASIP